MKRKGNRKGMKKRNIKLALSQMHKKGKKECADADKETPESRKARGLCDVHLFHNHVEREIKRINIDGITQIFVDAVTLGNGNRRYNELWFSFGSLSAPPQECSAIVKAFTIYADQVPPMESQDLFQAPELKIPGYSRKDIYQKSLPVYKARDGQPREDKGWPYLFDLLDKDSDYFKRFEKDPRFKNVFVQRMAKAMKMGVGIDAYYWNVSEAGYILGFWLAKLYNAKGFSDDDLPRDLFAAKEHFLELNGWEFDDAVLSMLPITNQ